MQTVTLFGEVLEAANKLPLDEQESLIEILRRRIAEHRRIDLAKDIQDARQEFQAGQVKVATPDEIMAEILS
ncbi:MAG: hypothetical protein GY796_27780 [Chloroflexi bacterium]|nr:hypothetical protein [Chloroflexota bacterium]